MAQKINPKGAGGNRRQFIDFDAWEQEQRQPDPIEFRFAGRDYSITPKLSLVMNRKLARLDADVRQMDPQKLNDPMENVRVVERVGEIFSALIGKEAWEQLLEDGFDIPKMFHFLEVIGNADAEHKAAVGEPDEGEGETHEPDPEAAPGEGGESEGKVSASPSKTSSETGEPSSQTYPASMQSPAGSFIG